MKILQINTTVNSGSTGRIAEEIGQLLISQGHQSYIAYGRGNRPSESITIKIGNRIDQANHLIQTRFFDRHGFASKRATNNLVKQIEKINPDLIHLHNLHGYYINIEVLFNYLKEADKPVVWTLHDCWAFTGHCSHYEGVGCYKWQKKCYACPNKKKYPASYFIDNSKSNFDKKKKIFSSLLNLKIVTPSSWLKNQLQNSFLSGYDSQVINNGVDLKIFKQVLKNNNEIDGKYVLGVANTWKGKKAYNDFIELRGKLNNTIKILLIGLDEKQIKSLPPGIIGVTRTENIARLASYYSSALAFINPTYNDTFPTTNIEALACGTPVITYKTGGSPEAIDMDTGLVIEKGDIIGLKDAANNILKNGKEHYRKKCRERAEKYFNKNDRFQEYINLYQELLEK